MCERTAPFRDVASACLLPVDALSVRQPWAWAIVAGHKPVENRSRGALTGADFKPRPVAIHASQGMTRAEYDEAAEFMASVGVQCPPAAALPRGAIVGAATLTAVVDAHDSPWFFGPRGLVLADAYAITPIPAAGALGFFRWAPGGQMAAPRPWMTLRDLLGAKPPRKPARVLMHVYDAGDLPGGARGVCFRCHRCGHNTGWVEAATLTEDKRGRPCPMCNSQTGAQ